MPCADDFIASACHDLAVASQALQQQGQRTNPLERPTRWRNAYVKAERVRMALQLLQSPGPEPVLPVLSGGVADRPRLEAS